MNTITANQIIYKENLSAKAKVVYQYLAFRSNKANTCFPALKTIARDCAISVSSVQRGLRELLESGFIRKKHNYRENGSQTSNIYELIETVGERARAAEENMQQRIQELRRRMQYKEEKKLQLQMDFSREQTLEETKKGDFSLLNLVKYFKFKHLTRGASQKEHPIT